MKLRNETTAGVPAGTNGSRRRGLKLVAALLTAVSAAVTGCGGGGTKTITKTVDHTVTVEVPADLIYGMTVTKTPLSCTGAPSGCVANGVEQYQVDITVTLTGTTATDTAPVALNVTAPTGSNIHLDSAPGSSAYTTATIGVLPGGSAATFYVRATTAGTYTVDISHLAPSNVTTLLQTVTNLVFATDPNVPTSIELFEAHDFLSTPTTSNTVVKARLKNASDQIITGASAAGFKVAWSSTDILGLFGSLSPANSSFDSTTGIAQATFSTTTLYPSGGTITLQAALVGTALVGQKDVTVYKDLASPVAAEYGVVGRTNILGASPNPIPSYLVSAGGIDGFLGADGSPAVPVASRADEFQLKIRILSADEVTQGLGCNSFTPGGVGTVVCLPSDTKIQIDCLPALDPGNSSVVLAANDCWFSTTANGSPGNVRSNSLLLDCGVQANADSCVNTVFFRVAKNSVKTRTGVGFNKIFPNLRIRTSGTINATPSLTRRYGSQSSQAPVEATWGALTFPANSVAGEENLIRLLPDASLPFIVSWVDPVPASTPTGDCSIVAGSTAGNKVVQCSENPPDYPLACYQDSFPPAGLPVYDPNLCSSAVNAQCATPGSFQSGVCNSTALSNDLPRIPLRMQILPSTCRSLQDLTDHPSDCAQWLNATDGSSSQVAVNFTYGGSQTQAPYVVSTHIAFLSSSTQTQNLDNISVASDLASAWFPLDIGDLSNTGQTFLMPPLTTTAGTTPPLYSVSMTATPVSTVNSIATTGLPTASQSVTVNPSCFTPVSISCVRTLPDVGVAPTEPSCLQNSSSRTIEANNNVIRAGFPSGGDCMYVTCTVKTFGELNAAQSVDGQVMCPLAAASYKLPDANNYSIRFIDQGRTGVDQLVGSLDGQEIDADGGSGESNGVEVQFAAEPAVANAQPNFGLSSDTSNKNLNVTISSQKASAYIRVRSTSRSASQTAGYIVRLQEKPSSSAPNPLDPTTLLQVTPTPIPVAPDSRLPGQVVIVLKHPDTLMSSSTEDVDAMSSRYAALDTNFAAAYGITAAGGATDYRNSPYFSRVAVVKVLTLAGNVVSGSLTEGINFSLTGSSGSLYTSSPVNQGCTTTSVSGTVTTSNNSLYGPNTQVALGCVVSDGDYNLDPGTPGTTTVNVVLSNCPSAKQPLCKASKQVSVKSVRKSVVYQFPMNRTSGSAAVPFAGFTLRYLFNDDNLVYDPADPAYPSGQDFLLSLGVLQDNLITHAGACAGNPASGNCDEVRILQSTGSNAYTFPAGGSNTREVIRTQFKIKDLCLSVSCNTLPTRLLYNPAPAEIVEVTQGTGQSEIFAYDVSGIPVAAPLQFTVPSQVNSAKNFGQP